MNPWVSAEIKVALTYVAWASTCWGSIPPPTHNEPAQRPAASPVVWPSGDGSSRALVYR